MYLEAVVEVRCLRLTGSEMWWRSGGVFWLGEVDLWTLRSAEYQGPMWPPPQFYSTLFIKYH